MNASFQMTYLAGGDDVFGPNFGGAEVYTNTRAGYVGECPNVGALLNNLEFTLALENEIMGAILNDGTAPEAAAAAWLAAHQDVLAPWLAGVTTREGGDAMAAVTAALELIPPGPARRRSPTQTRAADAWQSSNRSDSGADRAGECRDLARRCAL